MDTAEVVVRVPLPLNATKSNYQRVKLHQEVEFLRWLGSRTTIPISRPLQDGTGDMIPFAVTSKCKGASLYWTFGKLSYDAQVSTLPFRSIRFIPYPTQTIYS
jgi:hypothetical protein